MLNVYMTILIKTWRTGSFDTSLYMFCKVKRHLMDMLLPIKESKATENVIMPKPPNWISNKMTTCPIKVKSLAVSKTTKPVTQTADVEVNNASINVIP